MSPLGRSALVLSLLAGWGAGMDVVSGGELFRALRAGVDPRQIVYAGVGKTERELEDALLAGILMFNVESREELEQLDRVAGRVGRRATGATRSPTCPTRRRREGCQRHG